MIGNNSQSFFLTRTFVVTTFLGLVLSLSGCGSDKPVAGPAAASAEKGHEEGDSHGADEGGHEEKEEGVKLTADQLERSGIKIAQAGPAELREHLSLYGAIVPNAERVLEVSARFPGIIRSVKKRVGDSVKRGETLATVESNESLQTYGVVAPIDGVVTARNANEGGQAADGALFTVADLSTVWVELSVFPRDLAKVRVGQVVRVKSADTGLAAEGKVVYVAPFGSSANQTLTARVQLPNREQKWPPGLYVNAEVVLSSMQIPLAIQNQALQTVEEKTVVFVRDDHGFEPRELKLGRTDGEVTEVLEGLAAGESYATYNSFILKAELGKGEAEHGH